MNKIVGIFIFVVITNSVISQTVLSSCHASDSIKALYKTDADRLALKRIYQQNLTYTDSIVIPPAYTDTILKALIAVYNATTLPARNAVVSLYNIHTFPSPVMNSLRIAADSNLLWMQQLKLGNIPTGNTQVDYLISTYSLCIQNYNSYYGWFPLHIVTLNSSTNYNIVPLTALFENIPAVAFSETLSVIGDGNTISASIYPSHVNLTYSLGWGDCLAGCIYEHFWSFNVYYDCSVEYLGESGTPIPIPPTPTISVSGTTCTHETLTVTISGANSSSLNNQPVPSSQFTLSSPTATSYMVFASFNAYPASSSASVSISVIDCNTVGNLLDTDKLYSNLRIYPNPVDEILNLDVQILNSAHEIEIFDMFGKVILHEKLKIKNVPLQINVSTLSGGIYYIKTGQEIRKFIKE